MDHGIIIAVYKRMEKSKKYEFFFIFFKKIALFNLI